MLGVQRLVDDLRGGRPARSAAVVAEPTNLDIVHAHKGAVRWQILTTGRVLPQLAAGAGHQRHLSHGRSAAGVEHYAERAAARRRPIRCWGRPP